MNPDTRKLERAMLLANYQDTAPTMLRELRTSAWWRYRPRAVLWGARRGDRIIGSRADLAYAAGLRRIAELERRHEAELARRLASLARVGVSAREASENMAASLERVGVSARVASENMAASFRDVARRFAELERQRNDQRRRRAGS